MTKAMTDIYLVSELLYLFDGVVLQKLNLSVAIEMAGPTTLPTLNSLCVVWYELGPEILMDDGLLFSTMCQCESAVKFGQFIE